MSQLSELSTIRQTEEESRVSVENAREQKEKDIIKARANARAELEQASELIQMDIAKITEEIAGKVQKQKESSKEELKKELADIESLPAEKHAKAQQFIIESL